MKDRKLGVAIHGAGSVAYAHAASWSRCPHAELVSVSSGKSETARRLFESTDLVAKAPVRPNRHAEAQRIFDPARRKLEMSKLLLNNGFTSEALPSLLGAVDISLRALAFLREIPVPEEQGPFEPQTLSSLLESLEIDKSEISTLSRLNDRDKDHVESSAEASQQFLTTAHRVFDLVQERLHQAALR